MSPKELAAQTDADAIRVMEHYAIALKQESKGNILLARKVALQRIVKLIEADIRVRLKK